MLDHDQSFNAQQIFADSTESWELSFTAVLVWGGDTTPCPHLVHMLARTASKGSEQLNYIGCWAVIDVLGVGLAKGEEGKTPWGEKADRRWRVGGQGVVDRGQQPRGRK